MLPAMDPPHALDLKSGCCDDRSVLELQSVVLTEYSDLLRITLIVSTLASYNIENQCVY